jgi:hypothetical protein
LYLQYRLQKEIYREREDEEEEEEEEEVGSYLIILNQRDYSGN